MLLQDDHGASWTASSSVLPHMGELAIAEQPDHSVVVNMRNNHLNACQCRAYSVSRDGGESCTAIAFDPTLISPICEGSLVNIDGTMYFSNPASTSARENLTLRRAMNASASAMPPPWDKATLLVAPGVNWGGYSVIVPQEVRPGVGGILYETGATGTASSIVFQTFPLEF
jgi:sialidase-1